MRKGDHAYGDKSNDEDGVAQWIEANIDLQSYN